MNEEDRTRLEEFRQFRKEVRGSAEYLLVGIDVAKDKHHAFFGTATGKTLFKRLVFENSREGFQKLLVQAEAMKVQGGLKRVVFGMEPTANYHKPLGEHLIRCGPWRWENPPSTCSRAGSRPGCRRRRARRRDPRACSGRGRPGC